MTELLSRSGSAPDRESAFTLCTRFDDPVHIVELSGELDLASCDRAVHACASPDHRNVLVDLSGLTFMDCAGYGALLVASSILGHRGGSLAVMNVVGEPRRLIMLVEELERGRLALASQLETRLSGSEPAAESRPVNSLARIPLAFVCQAERWGPAEREDEHPGVALRDQVAKLSAELVTASEDTAEMQRTHREAIRHLQRAIESRDLLGQAKGLLMSKTGCSADDAFDLLVARSQHENRTITEIASELVEGNHRMVRPREVPR